MKTAFAPVFALTLVASVIASECSSIPSTTDSVQCALDSGFSLSNVTQALVNDSSLATAFCNSDACQSFLMNVNINVDECTINDLSLFGDIFVPLSAVCVDLVDVETSSGSGSTVASGSVETSASTSTSDAGSAAAGSTSSAASATIAKILFGFVAVIATAVLL